MKTKRIRQVNILELDQAMFESTFFVGLEIAALMNSSLNICVIETKEQKEYLSKTYGVDFKNTHLISRDVIEKNLIQAQEKTDFKNFEYAIEHFDEDETIREIFRDFKAGENICVFGYQESEKHNQFIRKLLKEDLNPPVMIVPKDSSLNRFHRLIVPFEPEYVTKKSLNQLKWFADQLGVMVDFIHFKKKGESNEMTRLNLEYEKVFSWIDELDFNGEIKFRFPKADTINEGLETYLLDESNHVLCLVDDQTKKNLSLSIFTQESLMDINQPVIIF